MKGLTLLAALVAVTLAFTNVAQAQEEGAAAPVESTDQPAPVVLAETQPAPAPAPAAPPPQNTGMGLMIGGWIWFGVMWLPSLAYGIGRAAKYGGGEAIHMIPIFGPIAIGAMAISAGGIYEEIGGSSAVSTAVKIGGVINIIWGLLEAGALTMAIVGTVKFANYKKTTRQVKLDEPDYMKKKVGFKLTPLADRNMVGLGAVGWF